jgi:hypothetical protein
VKNNSNLAAEAEFGPIDTQFDQPDVALIGGLTGNLDGKFSRIGFGLRTRSALAPDRSTPIPVSWLQGSGWMANEYWPGDPDWAPLEPLIASARRGVRPGNSRHVISRIVRGLGLGCRGRDCAATHAFVWLIQTALPPERRSALPAHERI